MTTGDRIKAARIRKSMTQGQLAERLGVQTAAVNKYETGAIVNLKRETIEQISRALDVRPAYLMGWQDLPVPTEKQIEDGLSLSRAERTFILSLRALTSKQKMMVMNYMQQLLEGEPK